MDTLRSLKAAQEFAPGNRRLFSATHDDIFSGATADIYFQKGTDILRDLGLEETTVVAEVFARDEGILAGLDEVTALLQGSVDRLEGLPEGAPFSGREPILRIHGKYTDFGIYETALLGILASSSGWATAAHRFREAIPDKPVICFAARHVHPAVSSVLDRAAVIGGLDGASSILGAKLAGLEASGTIPHAVVLIAGDTLPVARSVARLGKKGERTVLVDTFHDEAEEALRLAEELKGSLDGIRLDTPSERGGVTPDLVREVKARLKAAGHGEIKIFVSGGIDVERAKILSEAGVDAFGVGHAISKAPPIDMTMDLKMVAGKPLAKRGRIPGLTPTERLLPLIG